jgi:hypothetical protein
MSWVNSSFFKLNLFIEMKHDFSLKLQASGSSDTFIKIFSLFTGKCIKTLKGLKYFRMLKLQ